MNFQPLEKISKAVLRMSIAMGDTGGLGPTEPMAAIAQQGDADAVDNPKNP